MALEKESLSRIEYIKEEAWREPIWARLKEAAYSISMSILWLGGLIAMTLLDCFVFDAALSFIPASSSWRWSNAYILAFVAAGLTMIVVVTLVAEWKDRHEPSAWVILLILLLILFAGMGMWVRHIRAGSAEPRAITPQVLTPPVAGNGDEHCDLNLLPRDKLFHGHLFLSARVRHGSPSHGPRWSPVDYFF